MQKEGILGRSNRMKKQKIIALTGTISTLLGSIGAAISGLGLCPCVLAPIFSLMGIAFFAGVFLSKNKILFLMIGIILLLISLILHKIKKHAKYITKI